MTAAAILDTPCVCGWGGPGPCPCAKPVMPGGYTLPPAPQFWPTIPRPQGETGWRCPNCGAGNSPFVTQCPCAPGWGNKGETP